MTDNQKTIDARLIDMIDLGFNEDAVSVLRSALADPTTAAAALQVFNQRLDAVQAILRDLREDLGLVPPSPPAGPPVFAAEVQMSGTDEERIRSGAKAFFELGKKIMGRPDHAAHALAVAAGASAASMVGADPEIWAATYRQSFETHVRVRNQNFRGVN